MLRVSPASRVLLVRFRAALAAALATCVVLAPLPALAKKTKADKGRLLVLDLNTPPTMIGLGGQVVQELVSTARSQGYTVVPPDEVQSLLGPEGYAQLQKCEGQRSCIVSRLRPLAAKRVVFGSLNRDEKSYLLQLWLVDLASGEIVADVDRPILIASRRFRQDVQEAVPRLLRGEREARGTLKIRANVKNVDVWIEGEPQGRTPIEVQLKPGKYEVRLKKKAYLPIRRLVNVEANQITDEEFRLILEPGGVPEEEELPPLAATTKKEVAPQGGIQVTTPAWIAFGLGAATAGVGGYFGVRALQAERELENGFDSDRQIYSGTRARALQGKQDARTANILYGAAGVVAAAGVLFTVFDVGGEASPVTAVPSAGPAGAGVQVGGRF